MATGTQTELRSYHRSNEVILLTKGVELPGHGPHVQLGGIVKEQVSYPVRDLRHLRRFSSTENPSCLLGNYYACGGSTLMEWGLRQEGVAYSPYYSQSRGQMPYTPLKLKLRSIMENTRQTNLQYKPYHREHCPDSSTFSSYWCTTVSTDEAWTRRPFSVGPDEGDDIDYVNVEGQSRDTCTANTNNFFFHFHAIAQQ